MVFLVYSSYLEEMFIKDVLWRQGYQWLLKTGNITNYPIPFAFVSVISF